MCMKKFFFFIFYLHEVLINVVDGSGYIKRIHASTDDNNIYITTNGDVELLNDHVNMNPIHVLSLLKINDMFIEGVTQKIFLDGDCIYNLGNIVNSMKYIVQLIGNGR